MRIEATAIALRRREPWEATDLGFAMLREWWRPVYAAWALTFLPAAAALGYAFRNDPWIAMLLLWWLKPVFDRVVLHVLSRAVFGDAVPVTRLPAEWRDYLRPGLAAGQLWGRVDLARSFDLPVWQLERVTGRAAGRRRTVLQRRARYHAVWLTGACGVFEAVLFFGLLLASDLLVPAMAESGGAFERLFGSEAGTGWGLAEFAAYAAAVSVIEPCYVAGGFALYLNRRTLLEGWDIELGLRRCAARIAAAPARGSSLAAVLAAAWIACAAAPQPALAAPEAAGKNAKSEIAEVLKAPEFPHEREAKVWRVRWPEWTLPQWLRWPDWLKFKQSEDSGTGASLLELLARIAQIGFWIAVASAVLWAIYYVARHWRSLGERRASAPPPVLFGLEIAPESLPADVAAAAARLLAEGCAREALSLLYRGALSHLAHARAMPLTPGDTERDCLRRAHGVLENEGLACFAELLAAWEAAAYAGRAPAPERIATLLRLWPRHFVGVRA